MANSTENLNSGEESPNAELDELLKKTNRVPPPKEKEELPGEPIEEPVVVKLRPAQVSFSVKDNQLADLNTLKSYFEEHVIDKGVVSRALVYKAAVEFALCSLKGQPANIAEIAKRLKSEANSGA